MADHIHFETLISELDYAEGIVRVNDLATLVGQAGKTNFSKHTFDLIPDLEAIYFAGDHPLIYFKSLHEFDRNTVASLQRKVWNQGRVPLMFISTPSEISIINCYKAPVKEPDDIRKLEIDRFTYAVDELERLKGIYHQRKVDSGVFWETDSGKKIQTTQKVDELLVNNLRETRKRLLALFPKRLKKKLPVIHNLLGRSLFILYLEDRKVITPSYYGEFLNNTSTYFDLLANKKATYSLYEELNKKFNGDVFSVLEEEYDYVTGEHLNLIRDCFYGDIDVTTSQLRLFRVFDFSYIPIELISAIYEEFLHEEEGEEAISEQGAYYTPLSLVEFVLNEVLPYPDENNKKYDLKILDPACGSGIFLVEAYRRLIERWKYVNNDKRISIEELRNILKNSIHGVEKNSEAIRVASFSLYLTILNYLEPKYIWTKVKFPDLINSTGKQDDKQGNNLFHGDTFENNKYEVINYDLVIGNPPWKRGNLDDSLLKYSQKYSLAKEVVLPFLHKMAFVAPNAKIAMVSSAKILFNSSSGYENFRKFLFNETRVDCIVNFSALRKSRGEIGRKLFASATGPGMVLFYNGVNCKERNDSFLYCVPKPQFRDSALSELIIDASDIKYIPIEEAQNPKTNVWKVAMWGTMRDLRLIKKFSKESKLIDILNESSKWKHGGGFRTTNPKRFTNKKLKQMPHLPTGMVDRYYTNKGNTERITDTQFERLGETGAYKAPHIIIKEGQANKRFCASFLDYDCTYRNNTYGIGGPISSDTLKTITAYFNSKFATYYLFLSLSSWGIERERVEFNQMLSIPAFPFLFDPKSQSNIVKAINKIISLKKGNSLYQEQDILQLEEEIDKIILDEIGISKDERCLIENTVESSLDYFQEGVKSKAITPVQKAEMQKYGRKACKNLSKILAGAKTNIWAKIYQPSVLSPLRLISIHFNNEQENGAIVVDESDVDPLLEKLNRNIYEQHSESIYFRKVVKYFDNDFIFIVKPNEKRFWTEAVALEDSDAIAIEMIAADK